MPFNVRKWFFDLETGVWYLLRKPPVVVVILLRNMAVNPNREVDFPFYRDAYSFRRGVTSKRERTSTFLLDSLDILSRKSGLTFGRVILSPPEGDP